MVIKLFRPANVEIIHNAIPGENATSTHHQASSVIFGMCYVTILLGRFVFE
jgi:hypothetical protein